MSDKTKNLKVIFAGTPEFAAQALTALIHSQHDVIAVYTQPDRPAGRGRKLTASPVKFLAQKHDLPVYQPETLKNSNELERIAALQADVMVVAAYGLILPVDVLQAPKHGCLNIHASLLPRWRGAAPIQRAILAGDNVTGVTIMQMDKGLDTGNMLHKSELTIQQDDTTASLHDKLAVLGSEALLLTLNDLEKFQSQATRQDNAAATYAEKISKQEAKINWQDAAENISRTVRAFNPWPIAFTSLGNETIRIWEASTLTDNPAASSGTIIQASAKGIDVATSKNTVRITKLQLPGGRVLSSQDVINSQQHKFRVGVQLG